MGKEKVKEKKRRKVARSKEGRGYKAETLARIYRGIFRDIYKGPKCAKIEKSKFFDASSIGRDTYFRR